MSIKSFSLVQDVLQSIIFYKFPLLRKVALFEQFMIIKNSD